MDEATYPERVARLWHMLDMRMLLVTNAQLERSRGIVAGDVPAGSEAERAYARKVVDAVLHPDTGEKIALPLRLSAIVPMNLCLDTGMILARGTWQIVAAQWTNQSYNAAHYFANRNATNTESTAEVVEGYLGATASSVAVSLYINGLLDKYSGRWWTRLARRCIPLAAVAAADVINLSCVRRNEFLQGVAVYDEEGTCRGQSKRAGAMAVGACVAGRVLAAAPILTLPPLLLEALERRMDLLRRRPHLTLPLVMAAVGALIQTSVPVTFGLFRQRASADVKWLEAEFQALATEGGRPVERLAYNKGI